MFCTSCGKDNGDNNKFCTKCGKPLKRPSTSNNSSSKPQVSNTYDPAEQENVRQDIKRGSDNETTVLGESTKIILERQDGKQFKISEFPSCIGKGSAADCIVDGDESVSRQHACIHENGSSGFVIEDMGSTNKTYVNGNQLESEELVVLNDGDEIKMGSSVFEVTIS